MITKSELELLAELFEGKELAKSTYETQKNKFLREEQNLKQLIESGETTGDNLLDWAVSKGYPYQNRLEKAKEIQQYLSGHEGDIFIFLDQDYYNNRVSHFHTGKITFPFLNYTPEENLSLVVEEGTMVQKRIRTGHYPRLMELEKEDFPFIEGLIREPFKQKDGMIQSTHSPFSMDDHHYVLVAGEENVLSYLHGKKIIPEATREHFDRILQ